jgi:hypothetical protein
VNGNALNSELLHIFFAAASALCAAVFALFGGLTLFFVKRAVNLRDEEIKQLKQDVDDIRTDNSQIRERLAALEA